MEMVPVRDSPVKKVFMAGLPQALMDMRYP